MEQSIKMTKDEIRKGGYRLLFCGLTRICGRHEARVITRRMLKLGVIPYISVKIGTGFDTLYQENWDDVVNVDPKKFASRTGEQKNKYNWLTGNEPDFKDLKWALERKKIRLHPRRAGVRRKSPLQ